MTPTTYLGFAFIAAVGLVTYLYDSAAKAEAKNEPKVKDPMVAYREAKDNDWLIIQGLIADAKTMEELRPMLNVCDRFWNEWRCNSDFKHLLHFYNLQEEKLMKQYYKP